MGRRVEKIMELEFQTRIHAGILYDYMLYHTYHSPSGILGSAAGGLLVVGCFGTGSLLYLAGGLVLLLYLPCSLWVRAVKQARLTPAFQKPLTYRMDGEGICVSQDEASQTCAWANIVKAVSTRSSIIVYTAKTNAWIFPRKDMGERTEQVIEMISTHVRPDKVKIRW